MMRKTFATLGVLVILLVTIFGVAAAQSGTDPTATPTVTPTSEPEETAVPTAEPEKPGAKFYNHPIVQLLDKYFGQASEDEDTSDEEGDTDVTPTPGPTGEPGEEENESGLSPIGEEIAEYHEQGMGFGQLVKIYAMVKASEEACAAAEDDADAPTDGAADEDAPDEEACTPLTAEELVTAVKGGAGMGSLFKEYGKPALLGVGHVKKALKEQDKQSDDETVLDDDENQPEEETELDAKGKKPAKEDKPAKGKKLGTGKPDKNKGSNK